MRLGRVALPVREIGNKTLSGENNMHIPFWELIMTDDPALGRCLDQASQSTWEPPCGSTWSSSDPFGM